MKTLPGRNGTEATKEGCSDGGVGSVAVAAGRMLEVDLSNLEVQGRGEHAGACGGIGHGVAFR
ncbi:hypothetical protein D3273_07150 [Lichenibacterium minor]|uniref:Uncharacterized protein n=1 Tax=Lichenibacterium minor TaxID=2316528 RepID=A0A4Q2U8M6_9HYPH|nr:hypothetical protein [Lichenibacterium minor]RYC32850.1 hypothetical protein D3273_07150 [Lichenibacterium minor]